MGKPQPNSGYESKKWTGMTGRCIPYLDCDTDKRLCCCSLGATNYNEDIIWFFHIVENLCFTTCCSRGEPQVQYPLRALYRDYLYLSISAVDHKCLATK
jgi:hypothetical protein